MVVSCKASMICFREWLLRFGKLLGMLPFTLPKYARHRVLPWFLWWKFSIRDEGMEHTNIPPDLRTFIWVIWHLDVQNAKTISWTWIQPSFWIISCHVLISKNHHHFSANGEWKQGPEPNSPARFSQGSWYAGRRLQSVGGPHNSGWRLGSGSWCWSVPANHTGTYSYVIYIYTHIYLHQTHTVHVNI